MLIFGGGVRGCKQTNRSRYVIGEQSRDGMFRTT